MMGSGWRSGGQHQQAKYRHRAVIYPSRVILPNRSPTPQVTKARLVGLG